MAGLVPAIHFFVSGAAQKTWMPATIGERSDAVLRTAMRGHDDANHPLLRLAVTLRIGLRGRRAALLLFQLLARFVGAPLQFLLQLLLRRLELLWIGRRTVIGLGEIVQRHR